jgi:hypothetical protein
MNKNIYVVGLVLLSSCSYNCKNEANIEVSELLFYHTSNREIKYCEILKGAVKGESDKLNEFLDLYIYEAAGYDHVIVLVDLINYLGEKRFIKLTENISKETKQRTLYNLETGLLYYPPTIKSYLDLELEYPLLSKEWNIN